MKRINLIKVFTTCLLMMFFYPAFGLANQVIKINRINNKGQRVGLWVSSIQYRTIEAYYKDGVESGVYRLLNHRDRLLVLGEYQNGKMYGTWFYFDEIGFLQMVFKDFSKNTTSIINGKNKKRYIPDYKCYSISYYSNGNIKNEGLLLWSEGETPESNFSIKHGEWKYYNENGILICTEEFK